MNKSGTVPTETDSAYFLKLFMYFLIGAIWVNIPALGVQLPVGLALGLLFANHEHFQVDRKIEYAVLLIAMVISFASPVGLVIAVT